MAQDQPRLDGPVPGVALELEGGVERAPGSPGGRPSHPKATARARTPPELTRSARGGPPPSAERPRSERPAPAAGARDCPSRTARAPRAPRPAPRPSSRPGDDRVDALHRLEQVGRQNLGGVALDRGPEAVELIARRLSAQPRLGGRRSARGGRPRRAARRAGQSRGCCAPSPCRARPPARPGSPGGGGARRSARRRSRSRPGASPRWPARRRCAPRARATWASASHRIRCSTARRSALTASSSRGDLPRPLRVLGEQQLEPRVGAAQPAGGVDPRRQAKAERAGVKRAGVGMRDAHQGPQSGLGGGRQLAQSFAHQAPVLAEQRHEVGDRGQRHQLDVLGGGVGAPSACASL